MSPMAPIEINKRTMEFNFRSIWCEDGHRHEAVAVRICIRKGMAANSDEFCSSKLIKEFRLLPNVIKSSISYGSAPIKTHGV